ncbi:hypothetical protein SAMD00024442_29_22 [Candidatus Symbiothrix dinenymphae]|nr:hypothetical protein SAMD00024442_29_22 [Candidatus Symbiothrix dinenymphae]
MKKARRITGIVLIGVVLLFTIPIVLLHVPYIQQRIIHSVTAFLEYKIGSKVSVGYAKFTPFNFLVLEDIYLEDQRGDTLLYAGNFSSGFDFLPLLQGKFHFSSVYLSDFEVHLAQTEDGTLNIQYIIDAFSSEKRVAQALRVDVIIKDIVLEKGRLAYQDIQLTDLAAKINLKKVSNKTVEATVKLLSFNEQAGFQLKKLAFDFLYDDGNIAINKLNVKLPHSELYLQNIVAQYNSQAAEPLQFEAQLASSPVRLSDIARFLPVFAHFNDQLELSADVSGTLNNLNLNDLTVREGDDVNISTSLSVSNLGDPDPANIYINGSIRQARFTTAGISRTLNNFSAEPKPMPEVLLHLGTFNLEGKASGYFEKMTSQFNLSTEVGDLQADVVFQIGENADKGAVAGKISSSQLNIRRLTGSDDFGTAQFEMRGNCQFASAKEFAGTIDATVQQIDYKSYNYQNVHFLGNFTPNSFSGSAKANMPEGKLAVDGSFLFAGANSQFNFTALANLQLDKLNLVQGYEQAQLSFLANAHLQGSDLENLTGDVAFNRLDFASDRGDFSLRQLAANLQQEKNELTLTLNSDLAEGNVVGHYTLPALVGAVKQTISAYLPSLQLVDAHPLPAVDFKLDFTFYNTEKVSESLNLPVTVYEKSRIEGTYNSVQNEIQLTADVPKIAVSGLTLHNGSVQLDNNSDYISLVINGNVEWQKQNLHLELDVRALNDLIFSDIHWNNQSSSKYRGGLDFTTKLTYLEKTRQIGFTSTFQPSEVVFNDSLWTLAPATIAYQNGRLSVHRFKAQHHLQTIEIEGDVSDEPDADLTVLLNKVNLDYIFKTLGKKTLTFGGIATGYITGKDLYKTRELSTYLEVSNFSFNTVVFGEVALRGRWDDEAQGVEMKGDVVKNDTSFVNVDGFIYPVKEEIAIEFDAHHMNAAFLRHYLDKVTPNFAGELTGKINLIGNLNDPTIEGSAWMQNGSFDIPFLNTTYSFSDWVRCKPDEIALQNVVMHDKYGQSALFNGHVHHNAFDDFQFSANIACDKFLVFDATPKTNPTFYGSILGNGTVTIQGTEDLVRIDAVVNPVEKTHLTFNFMQKSTEYNFINFVAAEPEKTVDTRPANQLFSDKTGTDIRFNLTTNIATSSVFDVIMDASGRDKISGSGTGNLQIQYGTRAPLKIFGNYQVEQGNYKFSVLQATFRDFEFEEGSSVTFRGDPQTADLNVKAAYTVSANIGDLDQGLLVSSNSDMKLSVRDNIPVSCILLLNGQLEHPTVKFDLQLPGATAELERQVKSYIRTEDMLNRQIFYLLTIGRFYTAPEYVREDARLNNDFSFIAGGLSTQFSDIIEQLIGNKFRTDVKLHRYLEGKEASTEVEVLMSSTFLNNRLLINGQLGYANTAYTNNTEQSMPLVGDIDVEYKLTKSGNTRLKAFNHYNYRNYFSLTPEWTQGVGILFRRDFDRPIDMFKR